MIDFDVLFIKYIEDWMEENEGELTAEEMESQMGEKYEEWKNTPCSDCGGVSPYQYLQKIQDPEMLMRLLMEVAPDASSLLMDRIVEVGCEKELTQVVCGDFDAETKVLALNLLKEGDCAIPYTECIKFMADKNCEEGLRELAVELLTENANEVKSYLFAMLKYADLELKGLIAEVLMNADKDDRTVELLIELFESGNNYSLYAGFMAKYNDDRFAPSLYKAIDTCNYADYLEIRNAIEALGGMVDDDYRDFSSDPTWQALKNLK